MMFSPSPSEGLNAAILFTGQQPTDLVLGPDAPRAFGNALAAETRECAIRADNYMDFEDVMTEDPHGIVQQTLAITTTQLMDFVVTNELVSSCPACLLADAWYYPETEGMPQVRHMPSVRDPKMGEWYFVRVCQKCGNTHLISAGTVWAFHYGHQDA